ncbi:phosphopentomutase [Candidatus Woesearchaeota archaeon]|nr:phosphopentomutase [Candidatus Woesearchaeota archaeon]
MFERIIIIVMDGVGIGYLPDADKFGDTGADTLGNLAEYMNGISLPYLEKMGLGNIAQVKGIKKVQADACFGKMKEKNPAKNSDAGHWEMMGYIKDPAFSTYPEGFPKDLIKRLEKKFNRKIIGNFPASGTEIIKELGEKHLKTGALIVYTSADSVLQIAAHTQIISVEKLYEYSQIARQICVGKWEVGRIIARPFKGKPGEFERINNKRKDYPLEFDEETVLDKLKEKGYETIAYGEVGELFNMKGITRYIHTKTNPEGIRFIKKILKRKFKGIVFGNLVDFDMLYGHRRNPEGFYRSLKEFDRQIPRITEKLKKQDLLIITADHGNDPTFKGTDHTREYVPLLVYGKNIKKNIDLGIRESFCDIGKTIAENFKVKIKNGKSFLKSMR